jgi:hypothetical protein
LRSFGRCPQDDSFAVSSFAALRTRLRHFVPRNDNLLTKFTIVLVDFVIIKMENSTRIRHVIRRSEGKRKETPG